MDPKPLVIGYGAWSAYSRALARQMRNWNPRATWSPKDLRNALPTWATTNGCRDDLWEQCLGHAPEGVTARHYVPRLASVSRGEKGELEKQMALFRNRIVLPLETAIQSCEEDPRREGKLPPFSTREVQAS
ncbi:MAG TPA: hypothetical protein VM492_10310 [Sumerlaeia bacterium]|nr:hypothetical protein [Sumerlaeia bacterium]